MATADTPQAEQRLVLSVLIAAYGDDVSELLSALKNCVDFGLPERWEVEILVSDQFDTPHPNHNRWEQDAMVSYVHSSTKGRARNRNELAEIAQGDYFLFLDADALPKTDGFLNRYCNYASGAQVVVGGTAYMPGHMSERLRVKVGKVKEEVLPVKRELQPYGSFSAFNFLIRADLFEKIGFDQSITKYGHEDTLFGTALCHHCFDVIHIDNPAYHMGIDRDEEFMDKTEHAVRGLAQLVALGKIDEEVLLYRYYLWARRVGATPLLKLGYKLVGKTLKSRLSKGKGPLVFFDLYKLLLFSSHTIKVQRKMS